MIIALVEFGIEQLTKLANKVYDAGTFPDHLSKRHKKLMLMLTDVDIDGKNLRLIQDLCWRQQAAIKIGSDLSSYIEIKRGVRQGCVLSPDLFLLYSEVALREVRDKVGIKVNGEITNIFRYADDTALIADSESKCSDCVSCHHTPSPSGY